MKDFVKGRTADEKFKSINSTLKHFSRRLGTKIVGLVPTTPIIRYVVPGDDGVLLNMICPADGKITQGCVYIESEEKQVTLGLQIKRGNRTWGDEYSLRTSVSMPFRFDLDVMLGDMITLWINESTRVENVWLGFMYEISSGLSKRDIPIDHIVELIEEDSDALPT